jgi:general secretion pathway protein A
MYNSYFGFSVSPFRVTPDPSLFYSNPVYEEAYANLCYGIEAKKGFIVITGEVGTGKTTLLRKLMTHTSEGIIHTVYVFNTYLNFTELLQVIHYDLGLGQKEANKVKLLQELNDFLITQLKDGNIVSVLVDEAQNLSDEALEGLRLLSNLETDQEKLIQIVLMGQPELQARLDQPSLRQLKQRVALQCRLLPLRHEEVCRYIDFRLRAAGYTGKRLFHPDAYRQIAVASNGIPRLVNIVCDNALLCAFGRSETTISGDIVKEVAGDLRLTSQTELPRAQNFSRASDALAESDMLTGKTASKPPRSKVSHLARYGLETCLIILGLIIIASFVDPKNFRVNAGRTLENAKGNLNEWALFMSQEPAVTAKANAQVEVETKEQRVIIPQGSSIYKIASEAYGTKNGLGMDLIKEFNPGIKSLARVAAGRALLLPSLTPETLLRRQGDGSYRLIVAAFQSPTAAEEYAQRLRNKGYRVSITPRTVSEDVLLYRIEIDGLQNPEEANHIWLAGLRNDSFGLAGEAARSPLSR